MTAKQKDAVQFVRVIDIALIAPALITYSFKSELDEDTKDILFVIGLATLFYNGYHFVKNA